MRGGLVVAGPTCSIAIDRQKMLYLCGKVRPSSPTSSLHPSLTSLNFGDVTRCSPVYASSKTPAMDRAVNRGPHSNTSPTSCTSSFLPLPISYRYQHADTTKRSCKIDGASLGGVTIWALTADEDGSMMTVAWYALPPLSRDCSHLFNVASIDVDRGQNAHNGELGMGPDQPKSATKPTQVNPLKGIDVFSFVPYPLCYIYTYFSGTDGEM